MITPPTPTSDGARDRKLVELRKLLADLQRRHDFEEAAKVRVVIERVESGA
jgi:protein-arginine kinase activator protein McsA